MSLLVFRLVLRFLDALRLVYARLRFNVKSPFRVVLLFRVVVLRFLGFDDLDLALFIFAPHAFASLLPFFII